MTRILITGASGFLGQNLVRGLAARNEIHASYLKNPPEEGGRPVQLDVRQADKVRRLFLQLQPEMVVHAAAISQPDSCEKNPDDAKSVIVSGTRNVAIASAGIGAKLVHISTDLVFDGEKGYYREEDPVRGISVYASAKIEAEAIVKNLAPTSVILRVAVLYGPGNRAYPGFIDTVLSMWREGRPATFFTDQHRTPTYAPQVAEAIDVLRSNRAVSGIFHLGGADRISRYDFARLLAEQVGVGADMLRKGSMWDVKNAAPRGADCSLISSRIQQALGIHPLSCAEGLKRLVNSGSLIRDENR